MQKFLHRLQILLTFVHSNMLFTRGLYLSQGFEDANGKAKANSSILGFLEIRPTQIECTHEIINVDTHG